MGGVEYSTLYLATALKRPTYTPIVIVPEDGPLVERCRAHHITVQIAPRPSFISASFRLNGRTLPNPLAMLINPHRLWQASRRLWRLLSKQQLDLIVTKGLLTHFYGGWAARRLGLPCIWHVQDEVPSQRACGLYLRILQIAAGQLASAIVGDANSITNQFPKHLNSRTIYNGLDIDEYSPDTGVGTLRQDLDIPEKALLIGNLARLTDWKGQHILIHAFQKIAPEYPDAHLVLIGSALFDNDQYEQYLRRVAIEGVGHERIHFAGYRTDTAQSLAALDIYVHPSLRKDTAPLALLSAFAVGLPCIISDVPGMVEVIHPDHSGVVFPSGNSDRLSILLAEFIERPDLRKKLGRQARVTAVKRFSLEAHTKEMTALFDQVLASSKSQLQSH